MKDTWAGRHYLYYGSSLLCNNDRYSDHQRYLTGIKKTRQSNKQKPGSAFNAPPNVVSTSLSAAVRKNKLMPVDALFVKEEEPDEHSFLDQVGDNM